MMRWVKDQLGFILVIVSMVTFFAIFGLVVKEHGPILLSSSKGELSELIRSFHQDHRPLVEVNFSSLYGGYGQFQILHPLLQIKNFQLKEDNLTCGAGEVLAEFKSTQIYRKLSQSHGSESLASDSDSSISQVYRKMKELSHYLNHENNLSDDFVVRPPFMDDRGISFAYILTQEELPPFNSKNWVEQHLSFFKTSELAAILKKYQISDLRYEVIGRLNDAELEDIIRGESLVITKDYLLIKNSLRFGFSPLSYWVYDIRDFRTELGRSKFELSVYTPGALCLEKVGNGCWTYSSRHTMTYLYRYSLMIVIFIGFVVISGLILLFRRRQQAYKAQQKNRLALQVLSHEFRTPVSSLLLNIEQLSNRYSAFENDDQDRLMRMSSEIYKLQRIVEVSRTYLQTEGHRVRFNSVEISSINNWILDFKSEANLNIQCELLENDRRMNVDPFWLKFILSNLVQNAFLHGEPPVYIRLSSHSGKIKVTVEDQGRCDFKSLSQMTEAYVKGQGSTGMGLGLNIIKYILDEWGIDFKYSNLPTSFTIVFKELKGS